MQGNTPDYASDNSLHLAVLQSVMQLHLMRRSSSSGAGGRNVITGTTFSSFVIHPQSVSFILQTKAASVRKQLGTKNSKSNEGRQAKNGGVKGRDGSAEEPDRETGEEQITVGWTRRKDGG